MTINCGTIQSYNSDRGFGFINGIFSPYKYEVFFHIKKIKRKYPEIAQKLDNNDIPTEIILWYEFETTNKGEQVAQFWLDVKDIPSDYSNNVQNLVNQVENFWKNISIPQPNWLDFVAIQLVGVDRKNELSVERDNLESQFRAAEEERLKEAEALRQNEIKRIVEEHNLTRLQADELHKLLIEMRPLNFKYSKDLSKYIVKYQLGYKYQHISGILTMREADEEWDFHGGFPTWIYKIICRELELDNQGTLAVPVRFIPFGDL